ncbi:bifunctional UDP-sugar hydrolase/5'-nucleotidase UshA [Shewanella algidipiscicola]|uniref:bifunctional UDP-sugar hydrolase/5'-nucleotidase UshA n=1 Tax=Shewanella algidipiscicola TaxID=614070 RepID=UPI00194E21EE|nr:bifunctional UDP-sugar hydrolase/5'-nucleotidase UshA [Shewanella algidipiscicola]
MMNKLIKGLVATAVLAALAGCNSDDDQVKTACELAGDACKTFTVIHTNDNHGRFWQNSKGEYGMAARMTVIEQIKDEVESRGGQAIVLSGGDINTGVPESDMQQAIPDFVGMNLLEYDAMAVGNHEFDNSLDVLDMQQTLARFPMLAANIYHKNSDERYFEPYRVFELDGVKVAIVGFTTVDTPKIVNPENVEPLSFTDPQVELKKVLAEIEQNETVDMVFALTHMGHYANGNHGTEAPGDVLLARSVEAGQLQAIIGGHSQNPVCMEGSEYADFKPGDECKPDVQNGTYIMQAHEWGKYVGRADFEYLDGELTLASYQLIPINLKTKDDAGELVYVTEEIEQDQDVYAMLKPYQERGQELLDVVISYTDGVFEGERNIVRGQQTNLGQLLTTAYSEFVTNNFNVTADFGVMNSGGIRASIAQGDISYRDVLTVQPFGNFVSYVTMTGAEVQDYLAAVAVKTGGGYPQFNKVAMDVNCDAGTVDIAQLGGRAFDLEQNYTFALIHFSAAGGDDYPIVNQHPNYIDTQLTDAAVFRDYFVKNPSLSIVDYAPVDGELTFTKAGKVVASCAAE